MSISKYQMDKIYWVVYYDLYVHKNSFIQHFSILFWMFTKAAGTKKIQLGTYLQKNVHQHLKKPFYLFKS